MVPREDFQQREVPDRVEDSSPKHFAPDHWSNGGQEIRTDQYGQEGKGISKGRGKRRQLIGKPVQDVYAVGTHYDPETDRPPPNNQRVCDCVLFFTEDPACFFHNVQQNVIRPSGNSGRNFDDRCCRWRRHNSVGTDQNKQKINRRCVVSKAGAVLMMKEKLSPFSHKLCDRRTGCNLAMSFCHFWNCDRCCGLDPLG